MPAKRRGSAGRGPGRAVRGGYADRQQDNEARAAAGGSRFVDIDGETTAYCWCGRRQIKVPTRDVRAGRTGTCGHDECHA